MPRRTQVKAAVRDPLLEFAASIPLAKGVRLFCYARPNARQLKTTSDVESRPEFAPGTIVRVTPPADATDASLAAFEEALRASGVAEIKLLPRCTVTARVTTAPLAAPQSIAQVVEGVLASNPTRFTPRVRELVAGALAQVGL